jgi:hypothetical protein
MNGSNDVTLFLVNSDGNILAQTDSGSSPLHLAVEGTLTTVHRIHLVPNVRDDSFIHSPSVDSASCWC